jgi:trehalose synthase
MAETIVIPQPVQRFAQILPADGYAQFIELMDATRRHLAGRTLWHVNSTAEGGGVAEMLQSVLGYVVECDIPVRWLVIDGSQEFFEVTKRLHHLLHGRPGDHGPLGPAQRHTYESALAPDADRLTRLIRPGDPVILHDPQTLGLAPALHRVGAHVVWSCHIGADESNERTRIAWRFLNPYLAHTERQVFSRTRYVWENVDRSRVVIIPPCIDAFSAKNQHLDDHTVAAILDSAHLVPGVAAGATARFIRRDGTAGRITAAADLIEDEPVPRTARVVSQISRWDPLKDHVGVLRGFCTSGPPDSDVHLVLAGPDPDSVADDPESQQTLADLRAAREALDVESRRRVHIACLPMHDVDENAAIVNALQRRTDVVVQKSLAEGFGLTVAEAMWKRRPTLASRVGGIQDQIEPGVSGVLVEPTDLEQFGTAVINLLSDPRTANALSEAARARVSQEYLAPHYLGRYCQLLLQLRTQRAIRLDRSRHADQ